MDTLNGVLGFAVLSGPLWLMVILLPVALWIAVKVAKRFRRRSARVIGGTAIFMLVFFAFFADEITGRLYFNHLCATEAGVKVYRTVELPAEFWDAEGKARFLRANGDLDKHLLGSRFDEPVLTKQYSSMFQINKRHQQLVDMNSQLLLGEVISFMYWGGWVSRNLAPHIRAIDCQHLRGNRFWSDFYSKFFEPASSLTKERL